MTGLSALWLPILLSAVLVFLVSSVIHMLSPWHKNDYPKMPNEEAAMDALRPLAIPPGDYMVPRPAGRDDLRSAAFADKLAKGPVFIVTILPNGMMSMARNLGLWFVYLVVVGVFAAYIAGRALPAGADPWRVAQFAGATAFSAYALALWQMSIWYRRAWSTTIKATVDALIYAAVTALVLAWLWPH
jgi:hypothetical protein